MPSNFTRVLAVAAAAVVPLALVAPALAIAPKPPGGGGKGKTVTSSCAWSGGYDSQARFGQAYVSVKFSTDSKGSLFPVKWTVRDEGTGLTPNGVSYEGSLARVDGKVGMFSGVLDGTNTASGSPTSIRVYPGEKISYKFQVVDANGVIPNPLGLATCEGQVKVPKAPKG